MSVEVRRIYVSPGHNFFGHKGLPPGGHPVQQVSSVSCLAGRGLEGDRFCDYKPDYKGQVTFFDWSVYEAVVEHFGLPDLDPGAFRRNVVVSGEELPGLVGREFGIQGVKFEGVEECRPCEWMDVAVAPGAHAFLSGRGGLRARILTNGTLATA